MTYHEKRYPLTREQEGLWIEWKMSSGQTSYNTCIQLCLTGALDVKRFQKATCDVVECFELLRSYFVEEEGKPFIVVCNRSYEIDIAILNDQDTKETDSNKAEAERILDQKRHEKIDLLSFPLNRGTLIQSAKEKFYFIGVVPHIISDGASALFFLQAMEVAYNNGKEALHEKFGAEQKSWEDYLTLKSQLLTPEKKERAKNYWQEVLATAQHKVPISQKNCRVDYIKGKRVSFEINTDQVKALNRLCLNKRTSLFSGMAALFSAVLYRYFGADDLIIGYSVNLRPSGYKNMFGFFVNLLPLRVDLKDNIGLQELIGRIDQRRRADREYQYLPALDILRIKRDIDPEFDGSMFNVSMGQTISRLQTLNLGNVHCTALDNKEIEIQDDISFMYEKDQGKITVWLEYKQDLFSDDFMQAMAQHAERLITTLIDQPEMVIGAIPLLGSHERKVIVHDWNKTSNSFEPQQFHKFFQEQAEKNPDTVALYFEGQKLTYKELNERANQLSCVLTENGLKLGQPVAIIIEKSFDQIVSLLAVLKAGGVYIPLEIDYPVSRVAMILDNSQCSFVLSKWQWENVIPENFEGQVLFIDALDNEMVGQSKDNPNHDSSNAPAYIIYTSGSTGVPKGVVVGHHAVSYRLDWLMKTFPLERGQTVLQNTSYSFDVSIAETWWPLSSGATLVLSSNQQKKDPAELVQLIETYQIAGLCFVPSALRLLYQNALNKNVPLASLKYVLSAGEPITQAVINEHFSVCPKARLFNVYGPTEATIYASMMECFKETGSINIGQPIDNTFLYILNENLQPQPVGVVGELYIGGPGLAAGYFDRDDLEKFFIKNPFDEGRIYKTGDLARFDERGNIEYLGRNDDQVKIRGFRIELDEIKEALLRHKKIGEACLKVIKVSCQHDRICAYYSGEELPIAELRESLAQSLPDYMIPSHFIYIEDWPRLPSGKINKKQLPSIDNQKISTDQIIPAVTTQEKEMAQIWAKVLRIPVENIGVNSNFFELGGDSLMAIEVASAAEYKKIHIEPRLFFSEKTIAGLLSYQNDNLDHHKEYSQSEVQGSYPLMPRHVKLFEDSFINPEYWNRCIMVEFLYDLDPVLLQECFNAVTDHHDALRIYFPLDENGNRTLYNADRSVRSTVVVHDLITKSTAEQERIIIQETNKAQQSFNFSEPPLIHPIYFRTGAQKGILMIAIHHLLVDMRSCRILLEDLSMAYQQKLIGEDINLPNKTTSLKEWSETLYNFSQSHNFSDEIPYWVEQLQIDEEIPFDSAYDVKKLTEKNQEELVFWLDKEKTLDVQQLSIQNKAQMNEVVLKAFSEAYFAWSGQESFVINLPSHGRYFTLKEISLIRTIGWVNTVFPMKINKVESDMMLSTIQKKFITMPHDGNHYFPLRFLKKEEKIRSYDEPLIFLNYVSKVERSSIDNPMIRLVRPPKGIQYIDPENRACYALYIEAAIIDEKLMISMSYAKELFNRDSAENIFHLFCKKIDEKNNRKDQSLIKQEAI